MEDFGGRSWTLGGFKSRLCARDAMHMYRLSSVQQPLREGLGTLLGGLGGSLGTIFGIWAGPWATFSDLGGSLGDLVAPNGSQKLLFWSLDTLWDPFWEAFRAPGGVWEVIWEPFGGLWEVFGCFFWVL